MPGERTKQISGIEARHDLAATADELVGLFRYDVLALDETQRFARRVLQGVIRMFARVQTGFANRYRASVSQPLAIGRDRLTVAQRVGNEVICPHSAPRIHNAATVTAASTQVSRTNRSPMVS